MKTWQHSRVVQSLLTDRAFDQVFHFQIQILGCLHCVGYQCIECVAIICLQCYQANFDLYHTKCSSYILDCSTWIEKNLVIQYSIFEIGTVSI